MMRLFIALPLPTQIEEFLGKIIFTLKQKPGRVKWVTPKNIHLTVKFLGDTEENKVNSIIESIKSIASKHQSVECTIDRIGGFPDIKRPKVIWAGTRDNIDKLEAIAADIEDKMTSLGFERENRRFKSHLTLGRIRDNRYIAELTEYLENYMFPPETVLFNSIVLFKSTLTPKGPIYERLYEAELGVQIFE